MGGTEVDISSKVRSLRVIFDQPLSMQSHVNAIAKRCFHYLRNIARIRCLLILEEECKVIVHTFVITMLNYCNVLLYSLAGKMLPKMSTLLLCYVVFIDYQLRRGWIIKFCFILIRHLIIMHRLTLMK